MTRKKRGENIRRLVVELDLDDSKQKALWDYWDKLTEDGQAGRWARKTLLANVPAQVATPKAPSPAPARPFTAVPKPASTAAKPRYTQKESHDPLE